MATENLCGTGGSLKTQLTFRAPGFAGWLRLLANITAEVARVSPTASPIRRSDDEEKLLRRHWRQNPLGGDGGATAPLKNSDITFEPQSFPDTKQLRDQLDSIVASQFRCVNLVEEVYWSFAPGPATTK
jgi:hypothetical protein